MGYNLEFLIRMIDEFGEIVSPSKFIPAAERYNLMGRIDRWVIANAFRRIKGMNLQQEPVKVIFINLSGHSLSDMASLGLFGSNYTRQASIPGRLVSRSPKQRLFQI